ncbi:hypothetical protein [Faucicola boevrei]|uniref:hypothetical protein n=1 Tax=Faucicola boevrei TaxID=346665 RepID=UPI0003602564|nr:hypothetical protein [Moraxella boevrei]
MSNINLSDYQPASENYQYPLIIKHLLDRAKVASRNQKIHYADKLTYNYTDFFKRINRLANVLQSLTLQARNAVANGIEAYTAYGMSESGKVVIYTRKILLRLITMAFCK